MNNSIKTILFFFLTILISNLIYADKSHAASVDNPCKKIEIIFARGSGQTINDDKKEAFRFFNQIQNRLSTIPINTYELGTESYGNHKYPATPVNNWSFLNGLGAFLSVGQHFAYGNSVNDGVEELKSYLSQRYNKCKSAGTWYVFGGYSQGAHVVGRTLSHLSEEVRGRIAYVGLFGDPKLYLPEGTGGIWSAACRGKDFSKWRRSITNCALNEGSLQARKPYLPIDMQEKVGLWCNSKDPFCDPSIPFDVDRHEQYKVTAGPIDTAAQEAAAKLRLVLAEAGNIGQSIDISLSPGMKTTGKDTVFLIDTTGSMQNIIDRTKTFVQTEADKVKRGNGRVALVAYRDKGDDYTAKVISPFSDSYATFQSKLNNLTVDGGGDWPEATLHALMVAMNELQWRNGAIKSAVILTDTNFHNPDTIDGSTIRTVAKRSLEIDPVNIYPVVSAEIAEDYQELAEATSGQVIIDSGDTVEALSTVFDQIQERPVALLKNLNYNAEKGQEIIFDASDSYAIDGTITKYEWDGDGDGTFEIATTTPIVSDTAPFEEYSGIIQVRVTADNGMVANASARLTVTPKPAPVPPPTAPTNLTHTINSTANNKSTVTIKWDSNLSADQWYITINDMPVGHVEGSRTTLQLTDVDRTADVVIGVAGHSTTNNSTGEFSTTTIPPLPAQPEEPEPPIMSTCTQSNIFVRMMCKSIALFKKVINGVVYYILPFPL